MATNLKLGTILTPGRFSACVFLLALIAADGVITPNSLAQVNFPPGRGERPHPTNGQVPDAAKALVEQKQAEELLQQKIDELEAEWKERLAVEAANRDIVSELESRFREEFLENHTRLLKELGEQEPSADFNERLERQKVLRMYLVELDTRSQTQHPQDQSLYQFLQKVRQLRNHRVANNALLQQKIASLEQEINGTIQEAQQNSSHGLRKKTIREVEQSLVGGSSDYIHEVSLDAHPTVRAGDLQKYRQQLRQLLRIRWTDSGLAIDRDHWDIPFAGKSEATIAEEVTVLLAGRGYKKTPVSAQQHVVYRGGPSQYRSNPQRLFQQFLSSPMRGHQSGSDRMRTELGDVYIMLDAGRPFCFEISANDNTHEILRIRQSGRGLTIQYLGDILLDFEQADDGTVRIRELDRDDSFDFTAENFAKLYRDQSEYCELRFFPLLDHLGIVPPVSRFDPAVLSFVGRLAESWQLADQPDFQSLLVELGSRDYAQREMAMDVLRQNLDLYAAELRDALDHGDLVTEQRMRVRTLVRQASRKGRILESEAALIAQTQDLLNDVSYLEVALTRCPETARAAIAARLAQLEQPALN